MDISRFFTYMDSLKLSTHLHVYTLNVQKKKERTILTSLFDSYLRAWNLVIFNETIKL